MRFVVSTVQPNPSRFNELCSCKGTKPQGAADIAGLSPSGSLSSNRPNLLGRVPDLPEDVVVGPQQLLGIVALGHGKATVSPDSFTKGSVASQDSNLPAKRFNILGFA